SPEKQLNLLGLQGQDPVQLPAQRYQRDAMLFPVVGVLGVADFGAPLFIKTIGKDRLKFCLSESIAQEILIEEAVLQSFVLENRANRRTGSHRTKLCGGFRRDMGGDTGADGSRATFGHEQVKNFRLR